MKATVRALSVLVGVMGLAGTLQARAADLGMPAPPLKIAKWVKGEAVDLAAGKGKNIYVVEFWATWCPPCRVSIPHLTEMQKRFKDKNVSFIGVSNEDEGKVRPFVEKQGDTMNYVVAVDDREGTSEGYMKAFEVNGIPHAFVIDKESRIVWQGHPMAGLDKALEDLIAGRYDLEAARRAAEVEKRLPKYLQQAADGVEAAKIRDLGEQILKDGASQPMLLNEFAWVLLTNPRIKTRDMDLATRAAKAAYDASEGKDASIADTYARALFENGKVKEAFELQKKAVGLAKEGPERDQLQKALKEYEAKLAQ